MAVVTVSRQTGSDGDEIARLVAEELGVRLAAREIIEQAACQAGLPQEILDAKEKESSQESSVTGSDMMGLVRRSQSGRRQQLADSLYLQYVSDAILQFASAPAVIAGRGSQFVLKDRPDAIHVHIYAPEPVRVARYMQVEQVSREAAQRAVRRGDAERAGFTKRYFNNANWRNPDYYHLMIDTGRIPAETAVEMIVLAARSLG